MSIESVDGKAGQAASPLGRGFAVRLALFFTSLFLVAGTKLPYLPLWLDWRGLSTSEIGVVTAAPLFLRIVAGPVIALLADRSGDRRLATVVLSALALVAVLPLALASGFWPILAVTLVMALSSTGLMPLAETLAMGGVRRGGLDYGRMRLWGSLSFIVAGFVTGAAVEASGPASILLLTIAGSIVTLGAALALPADPDPAATGKSPPTLASVVRAAVSPRFLLFLLAAGAVQSSHAVFYTFGVLDWQKHGISPAISATLWSIGVVAEVVLFAFSGAAVARFGAVGLIAAGGVGGLVRWGAMAFDPPLLVLGLLQALHGATFGAAHLGALHFMSRHVAREEAATAQALYASVTAGIGLGFATLLSGPLYAAAGTKAYLAMALLAAVGALAALCLTRGRADI